MCYTTRPQWSPFKKYENKPSNQETLTWVIWWKIVFQKVSCHTDVLMYRKCVIRMIITIWIYDDCSDILALIWIVKVIDKHKNTIKSEHFNSQLLKLYRDTFTLMEIWKRLLVLNNLLKWHKIFRIIGQSLEMLYTTICFVFFNSSLFSNKTFKTYRATLTLQGTHAVAVWSCDP